MPKAETDRTPTQGRIELTAEGPVEVATGPAKREPQEAISARRSTTDQAHEDVRRAVRKLIRTGTGFSVIDVTTVSKRSKSFIYEHDGKSVDRKGQPKKRCRICTPEDNLATLVTSTSKASHGRAVQSAESDVDTAQASYRERASQAEALARKLHREIRQRDATILDLKAQLRDPNGTLLIDRLAAIQKDLNASRAETARLGRELRRQQRTVEAARENARHEQQRNVDAVVTAVKDSVPSLVNRRASRRLP